MLTHHLQPRHPPSRSVGRRWTKSITEAQHRVHLLVSTQGWCTFAQLRYPPHLLHLTVLATAAVGAPAPPPAPCPRTHAYKLPQMVLGALRFMVCGCLLCGPRQPGCHQPCRVKAFYAGVGGRASRPTCPPAPQSNSRAGQKAPQRFGTRLPGRCVTKSWIACTLRHRTQSGRCRWIQGVFSFRAPLCLLRLVQI